MKSILIFILSLSSVLRYTDGLDTIPRGEFYQIKEAYMFIDDSIYTMQEEYVDVSSKVLFMFTRSGLSDSSIVISIDHGDEKVIYLGFAKEIDPPGNFDFLPGKKTYYHWKYYIHDKKDPGSCLVISEYVATLKDMVPLEYYRVHFLFEEYKYMFYCELPVIHYLDPGK